MDVSPASRGISVAVPGGVQDCARSTSFEDGSIAPEQYATHHYALDDIMEAYKVFGHAEDHDALKIVPTAD